MELVEPIRLIETFLGDISDNSEDMLQLIDDSAYELSDWILGVVDVAVVPPPRSRVTRDAFVRQSVSEFLHIYHWLIATRDHLIGDDDADFPVVLNVLSKICAVMMRMRAGVAQCRGQPLDLDEASSTSFADSSRPTPTHSFEECIDTTKALSRSGEDDYFGHSDALDLVVDGETHSHQIQHLVSCIEEKGISPRCLSVIGDTRLQRAEVSLIKEIFDPAVRVVGGPQMLLEELTRCFPEILHITIGFHRTDCFCSFTGSQHENSVALSVSDLCAIIRTHLKMSKSRLRCIILNCNSSARCSQHFIDTGVDYVIHWSRGFDKRRNCFQRFMARVPDEIALAFASSFFQECTAQEHPDYGRCFVHAATDKSVVAKIKSLILISNVRFFTRLVESHVGLKDNLVDEIPLVSLCLPALNGQPSKECFLAILATMGDEQFPAMYLKLLEEEGIADFCMKSLSSEHRQRAIKELESYNITVNTRDLFPATIRDQLSRCKFMKVFDVVR